MNSYDHRIKEMTIAYGNPRLFENLGVKPSTARNFREQRRQILRSLEKASKVVGVAAATHFIGISRSRYNVGGQVVDCVKLAAVILAFVVIQISFPIES